jgi:hypothetical protein
MQEKKLNIDLNAFPFLKDKNDPFIPNRLWDIWDTGVPLIPKVRDLRLRTGCGLWEAVTLLKIIRYIELGLLKITPAVMQAILDPELKQALVEAICLIKIRGENA